MKAILTSLIIIGLLFAGCKKDNVPKTGTYLLKSITSVVNHVNTTDIYAYDSNNRLVTLTSASTSAIYKYTYNSGGKVATVSAYDYTTNAIKHIEKYTYSGNTVTSDEYAPDGVTSDERRYVFTMNAQQQVTRIDYSFDQYSLFTYNSNGDITHSEIHDTDGSLQDSADFTYDTKLNPLHALIANNLHLAYINSASALSANNIATVSTEPLYNYSYLYLDNGFPASGSSPGSNGNTININFDYLVK
jgi:hypothetical protein